jgi:superfamily II DNA/RNA helicase
VGRTGRATATGTAVTLMAPEERRALDALARELGLLLEARPAADAAEGELASA